MTDNKLSGLLKNAENVLKKEGYNESDPLFNKITDIFQQIKKQCTETDTADTTNITSATAYKHIEIINNAVNNERKQFLYILDSIPEMIYVADMNTYEILFANKKLKEITGRNISGEKCYKVIRNNTKVCEFCNNKHIRNSDEPYFWEKYNTALNKYQYIVNRKIKWTNQKEVRFEMAIDISKRKKAELKIAHRLKYEENLALFSSTLLLDSPNVIQKALKYILKATDTSRVYVFQNFKNSNKQLAMKLIHEVVAENRKMNNTKQLQNIGYHEKGLERWMHLLSENKIINGIVDDFPAIEKKILQKYSVKSILIIPVWVNRKWFGFIGFDDLANKRTWKREDVDLLRTVSEILGLHIENQHNKGIVLKRNKDLQEANATKDKFFGIVAHDLKNPFNTILGFSELLKKNINRYDKNKIAQLTDTIHKSGKNTYKLLQNLLEWSRAQTGQINFDPAYIIAENVVITAIDQTTSAADAKNLSVDYNISDAITLFADKNMLITILRNLISNAIKFSHNRGEISISVEKNNNQIVFTVSDNGIGMPPEIVNNLFKIEKKVSREGTNNESGTGLGLLLCNEFVERHNGTISVESQEGLGSKFIFTIPV